jgi:hypothetical protein
VDHSETCPTVCVRYSLVVSGGGTAPAPVQNARCVVASRATFCREAAAAWNRCWVWTSFGGGSWHQALTRLISACNVWAAGTDAQFTRCRWYVAARSLACATSNCGTCTGIGLVGRSLKSWLTCSSATGRSSPSQRDTGRVSAVPWGSASRLCEPGGRSYAPSWIGPPLSCGICRGADRLAGCGVGAVTLSLWSTVSSMFSVPYVPSGIFSGSGRPSMSTSTSISISKPSLGW